jgi:protein translocase SecG subunit
MFADCYGAIEREQSAPFHLYSGRALSRRRCCVKTALEVAQVIIGILAVLGILLQTPKATGLGGTIGGGGDSGGGYRRRRGLEASLLRFSAAMIALFIIVSILSTYVTT